jgi:hypothetical protein
MRIIDDCRRQSVDSISLYLTPEAAKDMKRGLERLLRDPEASEHFHVHSSGREISCSIITKTKLSSLDGYTELERSVLTEK